MKTIKAKVHRLPTEDKSCKLHRMKDKGHLLYGEKDPNEEPYANLESFYLYITTDEEIKEGDWVIDMDNEVYQVNDGWKDKFSKYARKIIATTDSLLSHVDVLDHHYLPWIPQSFIEEYCKAGGIDEVLVEYIGDKGSMIKGQGFVPHSYKPKLNPDNTIIIHPVEEKMYSREEVVALIKEVYPSDKHGMSLYASGKVYSNLDKWIEENL